ncbi:histidine phosphatase superfamily [Spinellus fusiger]|nr:histidine phosphatase superfamily [Spinellus fusiger]
MTRSNPCVMVMTLYITLVRHGNTDANNEKWLQGHTDTSLNSNGLQQATLVGERLKVEKFDKVYCSTLYRCQQTEKAITHYHPNSPVDYRNDPLASWKERRLNIF